MSYSVAASELLTENTVLRRLQGAMRVKLAANRKSPGVAYFSAQVSGAQAASLAQKILAIPCRANATDITKYLRKMLLGLEATGYGHVQYSRSGSTQHRPSTLKPLAQNKLMRGLAR